MDLTDFREVMGKQTVFSSDSPEYKRVEAAYQDLLDIVNISTEIETETVKYDIFEIAEKGDQDRVRELHHEHRAIVTLLKAAFIFSDIYISVLLSEILCQPGISLNTFLSKPQKPLLSLSVEEILPAYCVVVYRNKVIAHHDVQRQYTYLLATELEGSRLVPYSEFFHVTKSDIPLIIKLRETYKALIPALVTEKNQWKLVQILFYNIPIGKLGAISQDRKQINRIAENGGCTSVSRQELIEAIDRFTLAVVKAAG
jgi:hypothetical protein